MGPVEPAGPVRPVAPVGPYGSWPDSKSLLNSVPFLTFDDETALDLICLLPTLFLGSATAA